MTAEAATTTPQWQAARRAYQRLFPGAELPDHTSALPGLPPSGSEFRRLIAEHSLADSWERPGLDYRSKSLATLSMLVAMGGQTDELGRHVNAALNLGITRDEIVALLIHAAAYCGVVRAHAAFTVVLGVFSERPDEPS